jgi:hypothetical protein
MQDLYTRLDRMAKSLYLCPKNPRYEICIEQRNDGWIARCQSLELTARGDSPSEAVLAISQILDDSGLLAEYQSEGPYDILDTSDDIVFDSGSDSGNDRSRETTAEPTRCERRRAQPVQSDLSTASEPAWDLAMVRAMFPSAECRPSGRGWTYRYR